ncbi:hypothetical protein KXQ82_19535 [Mucilaginibacter sp. HMF5004]|uniref:hypothetical protein n=1 Tax=Mucilaginibacter rivuli TaxID=2857527 RepID=UPI001C604778|nr:hypothetical protein [Mucilaginibacter rivuli]MBW4891926.1 hypothetical protein [Mucilaginibacter rivuli]
MKPVPYLKITKYFHLLIIIVLLTIAGILLLKLRSEVKLSRIEVTRDTTKTVQDIEVDTLETDPISGLYLVNVIHNGTMGRFWMTYGVMKHHGKKQVIYEFPDPGNNMAYINSGSYILCVNNKNKEIFKRFSKPDILSNAKAVFASAELPAYMACRPIDQD